MVLRSLFRNAAVVALVLTVAASSQPTSVASLTTTSAKRTTTIGSAFRIPNVHSQRKLKGTGCAIKPGATSNSTDGDDDDSNDATGNEAIQTDVTKKPKRTKAPKPSKAPKPTKAPKSPKPTKTNTPEATTAPVVTPAPATNDGDDATDDTGATTAPVVDDDNADDDDDTADDVAVTTAPAPATAPPSSTPTPSDAGDADADDDSNVTTAPPASNSNNSASTTAAPISDKLCAIPKLTVLDLNVGATVVANEDEVALKVVAIAPKPSGGSYIAFHTSGNNVNVMELDAHDKIVAGSTIAVDVHDFADIHADANGFVVLGTRAATGGGTLNCGNPSNLCGAAPSPAVPCFDMFLLRFEGGKEQWATKLTTSSASLPPYSSSKTGPDVYMVWWYAHHGRLAFDGTNYAAYFGVAISTSEGGCINIHQGDRMQVVGPSGALVQQKDAFALGCSHSGYERIAFDSRTKEFAMICKTDNNNRIKFPTSDATIYPVDLAASNLGDIVPSTAAAGASGGGGYWMTVSNGAGNNAKVHLMHFLKNKAQDKDIVLGGAHANERACHLAALGTGGLLASWEGSSAGGDLSERASGRTMYVQVRSATDGAKVSDAIKVDASVVGNRYQQFRAFPDGSVAYVSKGASATSLKLLRISAC